MLHFCISCITFHFSYKSEAQIQFYSAQSLALMSSKRLRRMHKERTKNKRNCSCLNELLDKLSHPVIQSTYICGGLDDWMKSRENLAHLQNSVSDLNKNSKKPLSVLHALRALVYRYHPKSCLSALNHSFA